MANSVDGSIVNRDGPQFIQSSLTGNFYFRGQESQSRPEPSSTVPFARDFDFVDRGDILTSVREKLRAPAARVALVGLGGIGKSQLAIEYSYQIQEESPETWIFWVHASNAARFEQSYKTIADRVKISGRDDPKTIPWLVCSWLCDRTNGKWLMILDNADDSTVFFPQNQQDDRLANIDSSEQPVPLSAFLPQAQHGSILITSRDKEAASRLTSSFYDIIEVEPMSESQALVLLQRKLRKNYNDEYGRQLAHELDYMPLAITQAAAYINRRAPRSSIQQYITIFHKSDESETSILHKDHGDLRRDGSSKNSIITTWQISFEQIRAERRTAADLLSLMSFFDRQGIPEFLLRDGGEDGGTIHARKDTDMDFEDDIDILRRYSLITISSDNSSFEMHRLVQLATRRWLEAHDDMERWRRKYAEVLSEAFPTGDFATWPKCQVLFPHAEASITQQPAAKASLRQWALVLINAASYAAVTGNYQAAEKLAFPVLTVTENVLGSGDRMTLKSMDIVSGVLEVRGRYEAAEEMIRRTLDKRTDILGKEHPDTLRSVSNLALVLYGRGRYEEAERLYRLVWEGREKALGHMHPETIASMGNIAKMYLHQGRRKDAETIQHHVVEMWKRVFGEEHPETLSAMSQLANVFSKYKRLSDAASLRAEVLEKRRSILGEDHPDTVSAMLNLAITLSDRGQLEEAISMEKQVLDKLTRILGEDHPATISAMGNLAITLYDLGKLDEALKLKTEVLEKRIRILGEEHPETITAMNNLAITLRRQGKREETALILKEVLEKRTRVLGEEHPDTIIAFHNLAISLGDQGKLREAEKMKRKVLEKATRILGEEHLHTISAMSSLANTLSAMGKLEEAVSLRKEVLEKRTKILGEDHPATISARNDLANARSDQGS